LFSIQVEERALIEIDDAYLWYENQLLGLGEKFKTAVDKSFKSILKSPEGFEMFGEHHRQFPMKKFPFVIIYEATETILYIDAVFHTSQDPAKKVR